MNTTRTLLFAYLLVPGLLMAENHGAPWTGSFYLENDLFVNTDKSYSNGIGFNWISPNLSDFSEDKENLPDWLRKVSRKLEDLHPAKEGEQRRIVFTLAQKIYTPIAPEPDYLLTDQRPYAGWLYAGLGFHERKNDILDSAELNIGIIGPAALAKEAQDLVHDIRDLPRFNGWSHQLHHEPGIQFIRERKMKLVSDPFGKHDLQADIIGHAGVSLGNVATHLNTGAELRFGFNLPDDFGTSSLRTGGNNSAPFAPKNTKDIGAHLFISAELRAKAWDVTLDGNSFTDSHRVDKEPLLGEGALGASLTYNRWKFSYAKVFRTREYRGQEKRHGYGSIAISYTGLFH